LYPEGDPYLSSDVVSGVKKSLVVVSGTCPPSISCLFLFDLLLGRNLPRSMTRKRRESVDSRRVPSSSCLIMISSS
jgi:hypothetical protein